MSVAQKTPIAVNLEAGKTYYYCTCGKSAKQPFCDGGHQGSEFTPKAFTAQESNVAYLCACKKTGDEPFCDGTHKKL